eukprot:sb/3471187/
MFWVCSYLIQTRGNVLCLFLIHWKELGDHIQGTHAQRVKTILGEGDYIVELYIVDPDLPGKTLSPSIPDSGKSGSDCICGSIRKKNQYLCELVTTLPHPHYSGDLQLWLMQLWLIESMSHRCIQLWLIDSMSHSCMSHSCRSPEYRTLIYRSPECSGKGFCPVNRGTDTEHYRGIDSMSHSCMSHSCR